MKDGAKKSRGSYTLWPELEFRIEQEQKRMAYCGLKPKSKNAILNEWALNSPSSLAYCSSGPYYNAVFPSVKSGKHFPSPGYTPPIVPIARYASLEEAQRLGIDTGSPPLENTDTQPKD